VVFYFFLVAASTAVPSSAFIRVLQWLSADAPHGM